MVTLSVAAHASAYSGLTDQFIASVEDKLSEMSIQQQQDYLNTLEQTVNTESSENQLSEEHQLFQSEIKVWIDQRIDTWAQEISSKETPVSYQDMPNIDFDKVRKAWLDRHNALRAQQGLQPYSYHRDLEKTAKNWSDYLVSLKKATHKRAATDGYYNYWGIKKWFAGLGVTFAKETGWKNAFSESIGYRSYRCTTGDCTQEFITATKKIFDAFVAEGSWGVHYRALVMPHFTQMGVGFQFEPQKKQVYTVIHYAEKIVEE